MDELNPYKNDDSSPELQRSVVAFIDILGYGDFIDNARKNNQENRALLQLREALDESFFVLKDKPSDSRWGKRTYEIKAFSDNIVIGHPVILDKDAEAELGHIFFQLQFFQITMILKGFLIRGAISIGDLYIDNDIVFGDGLIKAYSAERDLARDPRIILTPESEKLVRQHLRYYGKQTWAPHNRDLLLDADGKMFVNYLDAILIAEDEVGPFFDQLEAHKQIVELRLKEYKNQPLKWSKYLWAANYHNTFCEHNNFEAKYKVNLDDFQMRPTKIVVTD